MGTLALAAFGGIVGILLHVPAGGIIGAVVAVATVSLSTGRIPPLSPRLRRHAIIVTGTVVGSGVGPHLAESLVSYWLPALLMALWTIGAGLSIGWWISRRTGLDLATALLCFTPGGLSEMILVSKDLGADERLVGLVGMVRIISTVLLVPLVLGYLVLRR